MLCYDANLPFNFANSPFWQPIFDAVNALHSGYKAPTYNALRGSMLKNTVDEVNNYLEEIKMSWRYTGCSIMADVDRHQTMFPNQLFGIVAEVNPEYVVQFVTDSEPSYKTVGKRLEVVYGTFFWTPRTAHCLDLILEHLCKPSVFSHIATTIERAVTITKFIYNHGDLLNLMRKKFTGGKELCHPASTRFATNFISIQSLVLNRKSLQQMFVSDEYSTSRHSEVTKGLLACITRLVPHEATQDLITNQIENYREAKGMFGMKLAIRHRTKLGPVAWWNQFGGDVEELQSFDQNPQSDLQCDWV
ncbi:uncharacterized protein LOC143888789 [Tasmannia lanceolata]|uniref:uncharacterized protein LOC143888789 n=1 Tax=Tasmannia lanceolata TaxID=3420 RepID=UPI0040633D3A